jgi:NDP-sugar pyrophosphorylase family protein
MINNIRFFDYIPAVLSPWFNDDKPLWFILNCIKETIYTIVNANPEKYKEISRGIFTDKNVKMDKYVEIYGPALIGEGCELRHGAFIRENVIILNNCVIGNSTEIKNSVLFNNVQAPHYNYIGDSILGNYAHLGAGVKISNVLLLKDKRKRVEELQRNGKFGFCNEVSGAKETFQLKKVKIKMPDSKWEDTDREKFGAIIGDYAEIGVNTVINPGTLLEKDIFVPSSINIGGYFRKDFVFSRNIIYESGNQGFTENKPV